jgi:hypothetical protein
MIATMTNPQTLTLAEKAEIVETSEANVFRAALGNLPPELVAEYGAGCQEVGGAAAYFFARMPAVIFNRVTGLGIQQPATEAMVDELIEFYGRRQTPFGIDLSPAAQPAQLAAWLLERGLRPSYNLAKVIRGTEPPPHIETDLTIEPVTEANAAHYAHVAVGGFGMPDWMAPLFEMLATLPNIYSYLAYADDEPAAIGSMYAGDGVAALFNGATLPEYRRRGGQGAIMARRIQDAIAMGCQWVTTETGEDTPEAPSPSYHNMLRTGFHPAYLRPTYVYEPKTVVSGL